MKHLIVIALIVCAALLTGCEVETSGLAEVTPLLEVNPSVICPGESTTVRWNAGPQPDRCGERICDEEDRCMTVACIEASISPASLISIAPNELAGTRAVSPPGTTTFCLTATSAREEREVCDTVTVVETGGGSLPFLAEGTCVGGEPVWDIVPLGDLSTCLTLDELCNTSTDPVRVMSVAPSAIERSVDIAPGECIPNFKARDLNVAVPPSALPFDLCGETLSSGRPPSVLLTARVSCDSSLPGCQEGTTHEAIVTGTEEPSGELIEICDLPASCGNQICEEVCENEGNCPADCAVTTVPGITPSPASNLCTNNGGLQFQGTVCACSGVVDYVTICMDGTKFDRLSPNEPCTPDPSECQPTGSDGGDDGGQPDPCANSCGNQICEPACGETPNTCTNDCP